MGFAVDPAWTTETNRLGCFYGVFRSAVAVDWVVAISKASQAHYPSVFPHFPDDRVLTPVSISGLTKAFLSERLFIGRLRQQIEEVLAGRPKICD